jgi:cellulose synthase/poly-beta-1,6-N-acetylglucosamine synthase-like glycosyltransferase
MTTSREVHTAASSLATSSLSISKDTLKQYFSSNSIPSNNEVDIILSRDSVLKIGIKDKSILKINDALRVSRSQNGYSNENFKEINDHVANFNSSNTSIRLSFQLMTRAEPAEMVIATIRSLLAIKAADDEILIVDNNHTETALYEPLADFCAELDTRLNVHFYHIDAVAGFKAGALNLALGLMNPNATHVVVVDSDYQALPQARSSIATAIDNYPNHALLQFPQFYRDAGRVDVHSELNHYFNYHLYRPFNRHRALSTGTYAIIRRSALLDLGGWSGASLTEDAQMGVLMHQHGLRSQFIPEVIATGLLPTTVGDLMSQRRRWIYGNMQVLNSYFSITSRLSTDTCLSPNRSITNALGERLAYIRAHLSQLSAWVNFTGIFILLHMCTLLIIGSALLINASINLPLLLTPLYAVYISYSVFLARRLWAYCHDCAPLNQQVSSSSSEARNQASSVRDSGKSSASFSNKLRAWALHLNFWELGALSWLPVLWGRDKPFICTPKQQYMRTRRTAWMANIVALPKLLLILNMITAVIVSPLSRLYSPILFFCAITVCLLKLWAAKVMFANYNYGEVATSTSLPLAKSVSNIRLVANPQLTKIKLSKTKPIEIKNFKPKSKPVITLFKDDNAVNH